MQSTPPATLLGFLVTVLLASHISLFSLYWQRTSLQRAFKQPQTWIMISKCLLDFVPVVLMILVVGGNNSGGKSSHNNALLLLIDFLGEWLWPVIDIVLRTSSTCVTLSEVRGSSQ